MTEAKGRPEDEYVRGILGKIPVRKVLLTVAVFAVAFLSVEYWFIWRVASADGLNRIQTTNGSTVIVGGIFWAAVITLVFMWPMRELSIEGLRLTHRMVSDMESLKSLVSDLKGLLPDVRAAVADVKEVVALFKGRDFAKVEEAIDRVASALAEGGDVSRVRAEIEKLVSFVGGIGREAESMGGKEKILHFLKTLDALADYFDVRVS